MNNKNNNYRVMKFLEPVNKKDKCKGYVRFDVRGTKGMIIVSVEDLGDNKTTSDVYLYKDKKDKIKIGTVNNKKGMLKKNISFGNNCSNIEDYNVCGVVKDSKIVLYSNLFNAVNPSDIRKLEETIHTESLDEEQDNSLNINDAIDDKINDDINENEDDDEVEEIEEEINIQETEIDENNELNNEHDISIDNNEDSARNIESEENEESEVDLSQNNDDIKNEELYDNYDDTVEASSRKAGHKNKFEENLYNILGDSNKLEPLSVNINNLSWWKVAYDDRNMKNGLLPYYNQIISSYYPFPMSNRVTTCHGLIRKYGHYIFGIYKESNNIKRFVYGVPGEFKRDEQPYKGITGFKNWSYKNKALDGTYGYWIAFVDSNTGEVTEPPQIVLGK